MSPRYILEISLFCHDSTAYPVRNGETIAAAQEERFMRLKHEHSYVVWLKSILCLLSVFAGALYAWDARLEMNPDGISYLDMGDAYIRGDWSVAINGQWSPFYSWLLGLAMYALKPSPYWELPAVHLVNFVIYLGALCCFNFLLNELIRYYYSPNSVSVQSRQDSLPVWAWLALGYALFMWSSLRLISLAYVTPDLCVAAFVYLASGLLLRVRGGDTRWFTFAALGVILGFGYLSKLPMLPLGIVFLFVGLFSVPKIKVAVPRVLLAGTIFLLMASLYFVPLSFIKGRLTFGESGFLNYAWYVNNITLYAHWQGVDASSGIPAHPTRRIHDAPVVYEFRTPLKGTYSPWYDPSYWYEGAIAHFDLRGQLRALKTNVVDLYDILFSDRQQFLWIVGIFGLYIYGCRRWLCIKEIAAQWHLLVPAVAALGMFSLVHVEPRYIAPFIVLLWLGAFSAVRIADDPRSRKLVTFVTATLALIMLMSLVAPTMAAARATVRNWIKREGASKNVQWQVAEHLNRIGIRPGDEVAFIGYGFDAMWARLARVRIVAEVTSGPGEARTKDVELFWGADPATKARVIELFASTGAKAILSNRVPNDASTGGWQQIGSTEYYVYPLLKW